MTKIFNQLVLIASLIVISIFLGCGGGEAQPRPGNGNNGGNNNGGAVCGNQICESGETAESCPQDCGSSVVTPKTTINSGPASLTEATDATFAFSCDKSSCTFECKLDAADFSSCTSPKSYTGLLEGTHSFRVRAKDSDGNVEPNPAGYDWTIFTVTSAMDAIGYFATGSVLDNKTEVYWGPPINLNLGSNTASIPFTGQSLAMSRSGEVKDPGTGYKTTLSGILSGSGVTVTTAVREVPSHAPFNVFCVGGGQFLNGTLDLLVSDFISDPNDRFMWQVMVDPGAGTMTIEPVMGDMRQVLFNHNSKATTPITQGTWNYERKIVMTSAKSEWDSGTATFAGASPGITFSFNYSSQDSAGASGTGNGAISGWALDAAGHKLTKTGSDGYCMGSNSCDYDAFGYVSEKMIAIHEKMTPPAGNPTLYSTVILTR